MSSWSRRLNEYIHKFKDKLTLLKMDTLIQEKVSQKANELTATYDEKFRNYEER